MTEILAIDVTPYPVILDTGAPVPVSVEVAAPGARELTGELAGPKGTDVRIPLILRRKDDDLWLGEAELPPETPTGRWTVHVHEGAAALSVRFPVESDSEKDRSELRLEVARDHVAHGELLEFRGSLIVEPRRQFSVEKVTLFVRAVDDVVKEQVATVRTDRDGGFLVGVPAEFSGYWMAQFDGVTVPDDGAEGLTRAAMAGRSAWMLVSVEVAAGPRLAVGSFRADAVSSAKKRLWGSVAATQWTVDGDLASGYVQIAPDKNGSPNTSGSNDFPVETNGSGGFSATRRTRKVTWWARARPRPAGTPSRWRKSS